eukprot:7042805-Heterocapsa_arctica.AAC.1
MVHFEDGLIITGGHPIRTTRFFRSPAGGTDYKDIWTLPRNHTEPTLTACDYIYNLQIRGS